MLPGMFRSATFRLTSWYLIILMSVSLLFSIAIYQVASSEIESRLNHFQNTIRDIEQDFGSPFSKAANLRIIEDRESATANLSLQLFYVNMLVLFFGGFASYFMAKHSLAPIERAHEAQSRFTSDASHELRTPLAVMKTELEVALRDKTATVDDLKEVLASNLEEVDKLSKLSEMLLNISHLENNNLKIGPVGLVKAAKGVIKDYNKSTERIILKNKRHPIVSGNEMAIIDLIKILIDNAIQYSPEGSKIYVSVSTVNNYGRLSVTNSGAGIEADKLPHIFDRFYRADSSRTESGRKGFGLGLALAKNIVEVHGGELSVESTPGKETTFTFDLPRFFKNPSKKSE